MRLALWSSVIMHNLIPWNQQWSPEHCYIFIAIKTEKS